MVSEHRPGETRIYRKRRRAELERETRERITRAAVELHGSVGPARTTVSAIADRAGVQRATVYRHFPSDEALFVACSGHWIARHPPPDASTWAEIADPDERLRTALTELYAWYAPNQQMLDNVHRDGPLVPAMAGPAMRTAQMLEFFKATLMRGRPERGARRRRVQAAIGHAIAYFTWRSLTREQGLPDRDAVELMAGLVDPAP